MMILNPYRFKAAVAGFNMLALSPSLWIDVADTASLTLVDGLVSQINDKSSRAGHFKQATAANRPSYVAASTVAHDLPSIQNTATTGRLEQDSTVTTPIEVIYIVAAYKTGVETSFTVANQGFSGADGYSALFSGYGSNGSPRVMGNVNTANLIQSNHLATGGFRNRETTLRGSGGTGVPGLLPLPLSVVKFVRQSAAAFDVRRQLLNQGSSNRAWAGPFCEAAAFPALLAAADETALLDHLIAKWKIVV